MNGKQVKQEEPSFDYGIIRPIDIHVNPYALYDYIESQKILCSKCHAFVKIYFKEKFIKIVCGCGVTLLYPKREDRGNAYFLRHVSKHEVKRDGRRKKH
jgi:hypothetical protein